MEQRCEQLERHNVEFDKEVVFLNEHLTGHNKAVLGKARSLQRQEKLHFAGYFNGKIFVKPRGVDSIQVTWLEDLDKYDCVS
ncbi:hypothetical protein J6590_051143 [Homalodisca vitripennis]|nr:hypothetical protein J6590_051143 [Homalodisca vitripennis]